MPSAVDPEIRAKAGPARVKRMRAQLGWSVVIATVIERAVRSGITMDMAAGLNLGIFAAIAVAAHFSLKKSILRTDPESFAWRHKSPWQFVFWSPALLFMAVSWLTSR